MCCTLLGLHLNLTSNWQACVAMGFNINNTESEALAVSGNIHAKNVKIFGVDQRLAENITDSDPRQLLSNLEKVRVVHRAFSKNYCRPRYKRALIPFALPQRSACTFNEINIDYIYI